MTYYHNPPFTDWQKQIIMGTILGGSSIVKPKNGRNAYLFMRSINKNWLYYKTQELNGLSSQKPFTQEKNTLRWHSNCYPLFNYFHSLFYVNNKKIIKKEALDVLRDIGLAIWYGDAGKLVKGHVIFNTHKFGEKSTQIAAKYFSLAGIGEAEVYRERKNLRVRLSEEATKNFINIISTPLPLFMHTKLIEK